MLKLARRHGVEELMPYSVKSTEERLRRRVENGLRVKGTGIGQRVKGKESERTLKGRYVQTVFRDLPELGHLCAGSYKRNILLIAFDNRLEKRRQAMLEMPQMIQTWKEVGYPSIELLYILLTSFTERSRAWMEKVAEIDQAIMSSWKATMLVYGCINNVLSENGIQEELTLLLECISALTGTLPWAMLEITDTQNISLGYGTPQVSFEDLC